MIRLLPILLSLALAACTTAPGPQPMPVPTQTQLQTDAILVAPVLDIVVPALLAKPNISQSDVDAINRGAADIKASATLIANSLGSQPVNAATLVTAIKALAPVAIRNLTNDPYQAGLMQAAVDLAPLILQAAGVPVPVTAKAERARVMLRAARR